MIGTRWWEVGSHNPHVLQSRLPTCAGHSTIGRPFGVVYSCPDHSGVLRSWGFLDPGALCEVMVTAARHPASTAWSASSVESTDAIVSPFRWAPFVDQKWL